MLMRQTAILLLLSVNSIFAGQHLRNFGNQPAAASTTGNGTTSLQRRKGATKAGKASKPGKATKAGGKSRGGGKAAKSGGKSGGGKAGKKGGKGGASQEAQPIEETGMIADDSGMTTEPYVDSEMTESYDDSGMTEPYYDDSEMMTEE